jgi:hypothetical protein
MVPDSADELCGIPFAVRHARCRHREPGVYLRRALSPSVESERRQTLASRGSNQWPPDPKFVMAIAESTRGTLRPVLLTRQVPVRTRLHGFRENVVQTMPAPCHVH